MKTKLHLTTTFRYTLYGALFGLAFPVFSTLLDVLLQQLPLTLESILQVQGSTPLHWVIDTAPFFLGLFASFAGRRQSLLEQQGQERDRVLRQLETLQSGLEQRVTERARALELATQVGRRLSTVRDLNVLLGEAVELIRSSFNLYYAQVYLMDATGRHLVLRAGTGDAGALLVRRGHTLPVGPGSINGTAAAEKRAVIVSHTAQNATFRLNPLLPETRSEMAVPMMVGERVVGVLNLQHDQPGALTYENLPVFETLAGQFAVAVDNAELLADAAQARAEVEKQLKRIADTGWQEFMDGIQRSERIGYVYAHDSLTPLEKPLDVVHEAHVLTAPIQVLEAPVGLIQVEGTTGQPWTEADVELLTSVARQVAQHIENLRVLAQADRYRAEAEEVTRRLTHEGWQAYLASKDEVRAGYVYTDYEVKPLMDGAVALPAAGTPVFNRPLRVHGEPIGRLALGEVAGTDDEALGLLEAVAERLSAHIENLRLFEQVRTREYELEARSQELEASQRVTFAAAETADPDVLLDLVVNLIRDQFDLYHVQVYLADWARNVAVLSKSTGYAGQQLLARGHHIPLNRPSLVTRAINEGQPVMVNDVTADEHWLPNPLLPHTQSELVLPLRTSDGVIGALDVQARIPNRFTPALVALFQAMTEQVAMTFARTALFVRTQQQTEVLTRLAAQLQTASDVAGRVSTILDPTVLLSEVVTLIQQRFGLYHAHVYLLEGETLKLHAGSGEIGRILLERGHAIPLDREHSLVAQAARHQQIITVNDTSLDPDFMPNPLLPQTRSEMAVPLISGGQVLGVLDVQDNEPGRFTSTDQDAFAILAGHIATALDNARLFAQRKAAEEAIRESEERLRLILDSVLAGVVVIDPLSHTITDINQAAATLIGAPREEIIGAICHRYICPAEVGACPITDLGKAVDNSERVLLTSDGRNVPILKTVVTMVINGRPYLLESFVDITERKQAEEEIRKTAEQLREMDRLKSEFLANMSHELRTPLNSIIGYIQLLLMDLEGEIPEESYEDMKSVETNSKHLLNLINDVLDLARIEAGRMELHMDTIEVPMLLDTVQSNNAGLFIDSPLTFTVEAEPDLPPIQADPLRITQVLNNLISNAYKFTEAGGVTVHAYQENGEVCIAVEDTGIGIAEKDLATVFERFRQVDGSFTRRAEGTGLGLSITQRLVEMHGGRITVRSKLGEGSTFTVYLPAAKAAQP
ncbi:MAG: GAF domain-containing protein [Anaerolineae bacterium]